MLAHPLTDIEILQEIRSEALRMQTKHSDKEISTLALLIERLTLRLIYMTDELAGTGLAAVAGKVPVEDDDDGLRTNWTATPRVGNGAC